MNEISVERILSDAGYRHTLLRQVVLATIAQQVRGLREIRGWTQPELAGKIGRTSAVVASIEDGTCDDLEMQTLLDMASAFDVALVACFVSWPDWLDAYAGEVTLPAPLHGDGT